MSNASPFQMYLDFVRECAEQGVENSPLSEGEFNHQISTLSQDELEELMGKLKNGLRGRTNSADEYEPAIQRALASPFPDDLDSILRGLET